MRDRSTAVRFAVMSCRVLIVEDDDVFAELLALLLGEHEDVEVVARARDGREGVELARDLEPDVVTMDLEMPRMNGIEATARVSRLDPAPHVVVVSSSLFEDAIEKSRRAGAHGYVSKSRVHGELARVVLAACRGEAFEKVV